MEEKNNDRDKLIYDMMKTISDNQKETMCYLNNIVDKFIASTQETVLTIDKSNDSIHEHSNKESKNWRLAIIWVVGLVVLGFSSCWILYFTTPYSVSAEASAIATAESIANSSNDEKDEKDISQEGGEKYAVDTGNSERESREQQGTH